MPIQEITGITFQEVGNYLISQTLERKLAANYLFFHFQTKLSWAWSQHNGSAPKYAKSSPQHTWGEK